MTDVTKEQIEQPCQHEYRHTFEHGDDAWYCPKCDSIEYSGLAVTQSFQALLDKANARVQTLEGAATFALEMNSEHGSCMECEVTIDAPNQGCGLHGLREALTEKSDG